MQWMLSLHNPVGSDQSWMYEAARDAWDAYKALIDQLEHDGCVRQGTEAVQYGRSTTQTLLRDHNVVTVHLTRTDVP